MTLSTTSQREALRNLIAATDYLAATMLSGDPDKIRFAKDKVWQFVDEGKAALSSSTVQQAGGADALDAARYRRLKEWFASANFFPEEMDLDPGVALIFIAPLGLEVSADLDSTIDGAPKSEQGDQQ